MQAQLTINRIDSKSVYVSFQAEALIDILGNIVDILQMKE